VVLTTSTIKGEGKTFTALNYSLAMASIRKKVLLIGADLRNPQLHTYINVAKNVPGLSNYLNDSDQDWRSFLLKGFNEFPTHDILLAGALPPNPVQLLSNGNLDKLVEEARREYDFIVIDAAPTILVTDTLVISHLADATVYLTRANHTERELLKWCRDLIKQGKLKNVGFVINGLGAGSRKGYAYRYSYNYGYRYGYGSSKK
jgi:capsular exopolysaccharide synthesis family protein